MYYILRFDLDLAYEQRFECKADSFSSFPLEVLEEAARDGLSNYAKCGYIWVNIDFLLDHFYWPKRSSMKYYMFKMLFKIASLILITLYSNTETKKVFALLSIIVYFVIIET